MVKVAATIRVTPVCTCLCVLLQGDWAGIRSSLPWAMLRQPG